MSYVKSMFTLSAFSTFLKMIPINHIDTKSFLLEKNTKRARSLRICLDVLVERLWMKLDSLVPVLFRSREWLGVYMSQGNVLVPLQVSHQNTDLWLHQADPGEKKTNKKNNNIKTWSGRVHHKAVLTGNDVIDRWWSQLKVIPHQSRWFLSILIWCMRAALNSTYKAADSRQFFTDNLCLQHSAHTSTLWLLRALRLACMWRGNTDSSNKRKQENNSDCSASITLSASMNLVWTTQICAPHDSGPRITVMTVILLMTSLHVNIQTFLCVINVTLAAAVTLFSPLCACMRRIVRYEWWTAA